MSSPSPAGQAGSGARSESTGIDQSELNRAAGELIDYFKDKRESPQIEVTRQGESIELFTEREIIHLKDVKGIVQFFYLLLWITLGYIIGWIFGGFAIKRRRLLYYLMKHLFRSGVLALIIVVFLGIWALVDFDSLFLRFHLSSFSNDYWQLPSSSYLLRMFPEGFFSDAALLLIADIVVTCLVVIIPSWFYLRRHQLQEEQFEEVQPSQELPPPTGTETPAESLENDANDDISRLAS